VRKHTKFFVRVKHFYTC